MARVVVQRVAAQVAREIALEERLHVLEGAGQGGEVAPGVTRRIDRNYGVPDLVGVFDVDEVGDVVLVEASVHPGSTLGQLSAYAPQGGKRIYPFVPQKLTPKSGSRPISRVLWQGTPRKGPPRQPFL